MNERFFSITYHTGGTLAANQTYLIAFPFPWTLLSIYASATNDSDATLAASSSNSGVTITTAVIGDSSAMATLTDDTGNPAAIDADEVVTLTLDFDGSSGTAAQNVSILVNALVGEAV